MIIIPSPAGNLGKITYKTNGDLLLSNVNGRKTVFDFSNIKEGKEYIPNFPVSYVKRIEDRLEVKVRTFHNGPNENRTETHPEPYKSVDEDFDIKNIEVIKLEESDYEVELDDQPTAEQRLEALEVVMLEMLGDTND